MRVHGHVRTHRGGHQFRLWYVYPIPSNLYHLKSFQVFIIRFAERRIDQLLDGTLLDYSPSSSLDSVQFESEWSFLRSFTGRSKKTPQKQAASSDGMRSPTAPTTPGRPLSPSQSQAAVSSSSSRKFSSLRQTFGAKKQSSTALHSLFSDNAAQMPSPEDLTSFLSALHSFLVMSDVNPALITQLWSQVFYWTACMSSEFHLRSGADYRAL